MGMGRRPTLSASGQAVGKGAVVEAVAVLVKVIVVVVPGFPLVKATVS